MTERLNEKVTELHDLRTQNAAMEHKLANIHQLFSAGKEDTFSIINGPTQHGGTDHETHEEATTVDAREQDHAAEADPAALQEPADAATVAGEAIDDATTIDQSSKSRPTSPDGQSPTRWALVPHTPHGAAALSRPLLARAAAPLTRRTRATRPRP